MALNVDVISDPTMSIAAGDAMWATDLRELARYDTDLLKPAIIFADNIRLRTFREDMTALIRRDLLMTGMPMRFLGLYAGLSLQGDSYDRQELGVDDSAFASKSDATSLFTSLRLPNSPDIFSFERKYEAGMQEVFRACRRVYKSRYEEISSPEIKLLSEEGILEVSGWGATERSSWELAWTEEEEFLGEIYADVVRSVRDTPNIPLFDSGTSWLLDALAQGKHSKKKIKKGASVAGENAANPAMIATALLGQFGGLTALPYKDLIEMRYGLRDYLPGFRAAVYDLSNEIKSGGALSDEAVRGRVDEIWETRINPALAELKFQATRGSYPRELLNVFAGDKSAIVATSTSLTLSVGSLLAGASVLLPAATAASYPFIKAFNERLRSIDQIKENRLYLLYQLQKRIGS